MKLSDANAIERYFTEFLHGKMNQPLLPDLQKLSATFLIRCTDLKVVWTLSVEQGMLTRIQRGEATADCGFKLSSDTFLKIAAGSLSPQWAFFKRQVDIEGRMDLGLRLATVLAEFFKRFPFSPDTRKA